MGEKMLRIITIALFTVVFITNSFGNSNLDLRNNISMIKKAARGRTRTVKASYGKENNKKYKYFFKSLLLPGWGEYELGNKNETKFFAAVELGLIASAIGFYLYSDSREDDFKEFAKIHAGVKNTSFGEGYWINLGNYESIDHYNTEKTRTGYADSRYGENKAWYWDSKESRKRFDKIRISSENAETMSYYLIGGIFLNHLVSAINSGYEASKIKASVNTTIKNSNPTTKLTLTYEF
ncbi:MAG: hypothetical protein CSA15_12400 [Candidatus Delongbacteria bacterium]|nr:MAG: hypothetical protein CSA15_12400 [Candidatus Delongbacteria bacterium]